MADFAKIEEGKVTKVWAVEPSFFDTFIDSSPGKWIETDVDTHGGVHSKGGTPLHKNFAGIGYSFDGVGFSPPTPYPSWTKNLETYQWEAPIPVPTEGVWRWNEAKTSWEPSEYLCPTP